MSGPSSTARVSQLMWIYLVLVGVSLAGLAWAATGTEVPGDFVASHSERLRP